MGKVKCDLCHNEYDSPAVYNVNDFLDPEGFSIDKMCCNCHSKIQDFISNEKWD